MTPSVTPSANRFRFRAWHKKLRKMVLLDEMSICEEYSTLSFGASDGEYAGIGNLPGSYCLNEKREHDISVDCENMDNWTVMQSTGLTDKNGKEIFEGDVVRWGAWDVKSAMARHDKMKKVNVIVWNQRKGSWQTDHDDVWEVGIYSDIEVIGNHFENPDLLPSS